jgi:hypothetical protein
VFDLWKLRRERRRAFFDYERKIAAAEKNSIEAYQLMERQYNDCNHLDERMEAIMDHDFRLEAQKLDVVLPSVQQHEMWKRDED